MSSAVSVTKFRLVCHCGGGTVCEAYWPEMVLILGGRVTDKIRVSVCGERGLQFSQNNPGGN